MVAEEIIHAYQDQNIYPRGTSGYLNASGHSNIEFEAKFVFDLNNYFLNGYFAGAPSSNEQFYNAYQNLFISLNPDNLDWSYIESKYSGLGQWWSNIVPEPIYAGKWDDNLQPKMLQNLKNSGCK